VRLAIAGLLLSLTAAVAPARAGDDLPVPRGSRPDRDQPAMFSSSLGFRDTVAALDKQLAGRGLVLDRIGPYRVRGVEIVRWLDDGSRSSPWRAIHVWRADGKTWISFVKRNP
jgi:hypothetical protein